MFAISTSLLKPFKCLRVFCRFTWSSANSLCNSPCCYIGTNKLIILQFHDVTLMNIWGTFEEHLRNIFLFELLPLCWKHCWDFLWFSSQHVCVQVMDHFQVVFLNKRITSDMSVKAAGLRSSLRNLPQPGTLQPAWAARWRLNKLRTL